MLKLDIMHSFVSFIEHMLCFPEMRFVNWPKKASLIKGKVVPVLNELSTRP
jgi:hypothetical protein